MPPTPAPPSFYDSMGAIGPSGPPSPKPAMPAGDEGMGDLLKAYSGIFKVMEKMTQKKPELQQKFDVIKTQLKQTLVDVLGLDPKQADQVAMGEAAPPPPGGASPQEAGPPPPAPPPPEAQSMAA